MGIRTGYRPARRIRVQRNEDDEMTGTLVSVATPHRGDAPAEEEPEVREIVFDVRKVDVRKGEPRVHRA